MARFRRPTARFRSPTARFRSPTARFHSRTARFLRRVARFRCRQARFRPLPPPGTARTGPGQIRPCLEKVRPCRGAPGRLPEARSCSSASNCAIREGCPFPRALLRGLGDGGRKDAKIAEGRSRFVTQPVPDSSHTGRRGQAFTGPSRFDETPPRRSVHGKETVCGKSVL